MQFDLFDQEKNKVLSAKSYGEFKAGLQASNCEKCALKDSRTNIVVDRGSDATQVMMIGEGPGQNEDLQGKAFVGRSGKLLDEMMMSLGFDTNQDSLIVNVVKCRPPENRDPLPSEVVACSKYLQRQIELVNPKLIITLGRFSLARFFPGESISRVRGRVREKDGRLIYPIMHPAAALHQQSLRRSIEEDMLCFDAKIFWQAFWKTC